MITSKAKKSILIADDEPANIDILVETLSGYSCSFALNGKKAVELAIIKPMPDLILLDIMMPEMDGYETCKAIKSNPVTKHIPVIFLTAKSSPQDIKYGFEIGADHYFTKPINIDNVQSIVKAVLSEQNRKSNSGDSPLSSVHSLKIENTHGGSNIKLIFSGNIDISIWKHIKPLFTDTGLLKNLELVLENTSKITTTGIGMIASLIEFSKSSNCTVKVSGAIDELLTIGILQRNNISTDNIQ
ncbi:MAG: response regulator [Magnetococcales bacterium]|nr:response regulator [Magnetococcales bacterium]